MYTRFNYARQKKLFPPGAPLQIVIFAHSATVNQETDRLMKMVIQWFVVEVMSFKTTPMKLIAYLIECLWMQFFYNTFSSGYYFTATSATMTSNWESHNKPHAAMEAEDGRWIRLWVMLNYITFSTGTILAVDNLKVVR